MNDLASQPLLRAFGWALLHSLWQGALLALLALAALRLARRRSAELRYAIALGTLALLLVAFAGTLLRILGGGDPLPALDAAFVVPVGEGQGGLGFMPWLRAALLPWTPWLCLAWALGAGFRLLQMGRSLAWLYGPCLRNVQPPSAEWMARFEALRRRSGVRIPVRLGVSGQVDSLLVLGWLRPVVLMPAAALLALSPEALEALLVHELAHVRRKDFLANLTQTFAEALLFYHPAVWWLSGRIRQEREHACDDAAVRACGDPLVYASALAGLEELRSQPPLIPDLAPAASGGRLMLRIQRLLRPRITQEAPAPLATLLPAFLILAAMGAAALSARPASEARLPAPEPVRAAPGDPLGGDATVEIITKAPETPKPEGKPGPAAEPVDMSFSRIRITHQPPPPPYPAAAKMAHIQGVVVVVITIDEMGRVASAKAISGPEDLHQCAVDYARGWEFVPAKVKGKAVPARFKLTMPFKLR